MKTEKATFKIADFYFEKVFLQNTKEQIEGLELDFDPSGIFHSDTKIFELKIVFKAFDKEKGIKNPQVSIDFVSTFSFTNVDEIKEIPDFFYRNAIAIVFPYIRAFISNLTLLSNSKLLILPTMNMAKLEVPLRDKTQAK